MHFLRVFLMTWFALGVITELLLFFFVRGRGANIFLSWFYRTPRPQQSKSQLFIQGNFGKLRDISRDISFWLIGPVCRRSAALRLRPFSRWKREASRE
jgi:hypothetical protein